MYSGVRLGRATDPDTAAKQDALLARVEQTAAFTTNAEMQARANIVMPAGSFPVSPLVSDSPTQYSQLWQRPDGTRGIVGLMHAMPTAAAPVTVTVPPVAMPSIVPPVSVVVTQPAGISVTELRRQAQVGWDMLTRWQIAPGANKSFAQGGPAIPMPDSYVEQYRQELGLTVQGYTPPPPASSQEATLVSRVRAGLPVGEVPSPPPSIQTLTIAPPLPPMAIVPGGGAGASVPPPSIQTLTIAPSLPPVVIAPSGEAVASVPPPIMAVAVTPPGANAPVPLPPPLPPAIVPQAVITDLTQAPPVPVAPYSPTVVVTPGAQASTSSATVPPAVVAPSPQEEKLPVPADAKPPYAILALAVLGLVVLMGSGKGRR